MAKFVIHHIAPVPWSLIFRRTSPLETEPCLFWAFHVTPANPRLIVEGKIDPTVFLVSGQMKLWNNTSNDLIIQPHCIIKREVLEVVSKVGTPLAHYIIRCNLLRLRVIRGTLDDYVVGVCITVGRCQQSG